jgi:hypothetical protein
MFQIVPWWYIAEAICAVAVIWLLGLWLWFELYLDKISLEEGNRMNKCTITQKNADTPVGLVATYEVKFNLTGNELVALRNLLRAHDAAESNAIRTYFADAIQRSGLRGLE